jgi:riboflavin biosynthesis pyrimidine reductase
MSSSADPDPDPDPAPTPTVVGAVADGDAFDAYEAPRPTPRGRPWLVANMVAGLDGSLAWHGRVGELSSEADRSLFVRLRGIADGVMVGAGTVRAESYGPVKLPDDRREQRVAAGRSAVPPLVVVSRSLDLDWDAPLWASTVEPRPLLVTCAAAPPAALAHAREHTDVIVVGEAAVDLVGAMRALSERGMEIVLTEGGPTLLAELVAAELLDELCLTITPVFGGDPLTMAHRGTAMPNLRTFALEGVVRRDDELYLRYLLRRDAEDPTDDTRS